ncbi:Molybdopterin molybdenumtransferase [Paenibacillus allorhizoplanae]|uniref:Molybdopterin molybdenumtransferase n=1 Tax=Paenibacillus allorhizoplanae TaxID=2905648 RepID=A0ABN8GIL4_9BACL|nr:gephyrin-like molybdotransferase Glp [Paenibacillus allorhizoplanae]CAH1209960.1 Molybdopterin molybdenumtransferase [Paenibacillus allorhizoplanae]
MSSEMKLRFGRKVISVDEARAALYEYVKPTETETVSLPTSFGRMLAKDIYADHAVPHFRRSGVDGYAVRSQDIAAATPDNPIVLDVIERIPSGTIPKCTVRAGKAARIMTGAPIPDGADTVVMLEMTDSLQDELLSLLGAKVKIKKNVQAASNITPIAGEVTLGELVIPEGTRIGPGEAAILATFGFSMVEVYRRPRVAIFSTGSELLQVEQELQPGKIRNSNSYMLAAQVEANGGAALIMPALSDDPGQVEAALEAILPDVDLILTSGGVSVGDYDVLVDVFGRFDGKLLFNKVAMRPGTPTSAALWKGKLLMALSGNPGASFVGFELFAKPIIRSMLGSQRPESEGLTAFLDVPYDKPSAYPRYIRGTTRVEAGCLWVRPAGIDKSSIMVSIKDADCLIWLPAGGQGYQRGDSVKVYTTR